MAHTWKLTCLAHSILDILWRIPHLLLSLDYFKNTATNTKLNNFFSIRPVLCYYSNIFHSFWTIGLQYIYTNNINTNTKGSSMRQKRGNQKNCQTTEYKHAFSNYAFTVSMESPFEKLERHDDHSHSDETSRENLVLPKQTQNLGPLLWSALGE